MFPWTVFIEYFGAKDDVGVFRPASFSLSSKVAKIGPKQHKYVCNPIRLHFLRCLWTQRLLNGAQHYIPRQQSDSTDHVTCQNLAKIAKISPWQDCCFAFVTPLVCLGMLQLGWTLSTLKPTQKIRKKHKGYDNSETTIGKLSARKIQIWLDYFCKIYF